MRLLIDFKIDMDVISLGWAGLVTMFTFSLASVVWARNCCLRVDIAGPAQTVTLSMVLRWDLAAQRRPWLGMVFMHGTPSLSTGTF